MIATKIDIVLLNDKELETMNTFIRTFLKCSGIPCDICPLYCNDSCLLAKVIKAKDKQLEYRHQLEIETITE